MCVCLATRDSSSLIVLDCGGGGVLSPPQAREVTLSFSSGGGARDRAVFGSGS